MQRLKSEPAAAAAGISPSTTSGTESETARSRRSSLLLRLMTAAVGLPVLLVAILWPGTSFPFPGWPLAVVITLLVLVGLHEFYAACRIAGFSPQEWTGYLAGLLFVFFATPYAPENPGWARIIFTLLMMVSLASETLRPDRAPLKNLAPTWMGAIYIGLLFSYALRLRLQPAADLASSQLGWHATGPLAYFGSGAILLCFTVLVTIAVDSAAFFVGRALGKHKLAPRLSPGKTWEGAAGGLAGAMAGAVGLGFWFGLPLVFCLVAGVLIALCSIMGDLTTSAIKREVGLKDFGRLLPGHGGVLDRFDSLLFSGPVMYGLIQVWPAPR